MGVILPGELSILFYFILYKTSELPILRIYLSNEIIHVLIVCQRNAMVLYNSHLILFFIFYYFQVI